MTILARIVLATALFMQCHALRRDLLGGRSDKRNADGQTSASVSPQAFILQAERARAVHKLLIRTKHEWNLTFDSSGLGPLRSTARELELAAYLQQLLDIAGTLLRDANGCKVGSKKRKRGRGGSRDDAGSGGSGGCPAAAPELLQGGTSAFLASLLRAHPRGPTSREALAAWAAAATAFLHQHRELQRQAAALAAGAAADAAAVKTAAKAAASGAEDSKLDVTDVSEVGGELGFGGSGGKSGRGKRRKTLPRRKLAAKNSGEAGHARLGSDSGTDSDIEGEDGVAGIAAPPPNLTAVQYGGLPLVRRVLLAQLLLGWMTCLNRHLVGESHLAVEMSRVVALLYDIHVESVAQRAVAEYFHISEAGGNSWATAASANGCRNPSATAARVRPFDDECRWINGTLMRQLGLAVVTRPGARQVCSRFDVPARMSPFTDCEGRWRYALSQGHQYIANEYTLMGGLHDMYGTHICPQFVNIISVREPLARLASNIKYMMARLRSVLFRKPPAAELFSRIFCNAPSAVWEAFAPPVADNYNIRSLVGERGFHTPLNGIGEAHLALAKQLLAQYDLVLDLNAGDAAADLLMREGLGWNTTLAEIRVWTGDRLARKSGLDLEEECRLGDLTPLLRRQVYDQRWYSFGRTLSRLDQLFLSAAAHMGLRPWPAEWAAEQQRQQQGQQQRGAASGTGIASAGWPAAGGAPAGSRCGLLGAAEAMRGSRQSHQ